MERKTIGGFIATLRKANGMTQKELAERLNVSDKTISRWERDEGVPDLSVIPVLAEIFGVTCDELLRGERKPVTERLGEEEVVISSKGEKQKQRILTICLSKYKTRSFIAMGIAMTGFIGAMIGNFGFLRAYIGFFVGAIFYLASMICQAVFINGAFLSVADDSLNSEEVGRFKGNIIKLAEMSLGLTSVLVGASVPLLVFPHDTYVGLSGESWFLYGAIFGGITLLLYSMVCMVLNEKLLKKGVYYLGERDEEIYWYNRALKGKCAGVFVIILFLTYVGHFLATSGWNETAFAKGTEFHDYESFIEYMEQDIPYQDIYSMGENMPIATEQTVAGETIYYDEYGNEISEEEALHRTIRLYDENGAGKVVCEYIERNEMVSSIRYTTKGDTVLPITVLTYDDLRMARARLNVVNLLFSFVYCMEVVGIVMFYLKKRKK